MYRCILVLVEGVGFVTSFINVVARITLLSAMAPIIAGAATLGRSLFSETMINDSIQWLYDTFHELWDAS